MRGIALLTFPILAFALGGCVARTAVNVATAPVRVAGKAVDLATTSQSERDEKRGRELRKLEERAGKLERQYQREQQDCLDGDHRACRVAQGTYAELQLVLRQLPAPPAAD